MTQKAIQKEVARHLEGIRYKDYMSIVISPIREQGDEKRKLRLPSGKEITEASVIKRFFKSIDTGDDALHKPWNWTGRATKSGLPRFKYKGKDYDAVVMMYLFATGFEKKPKGVRIKSFITGNINPYYLYIEPMDKEEAKEVKLIASRKKQSTFWQKLFDFFWGE